MRVGLVGLGSIAAVHLEALAEIPQMDLVFTVDPVAERVQFRGDSPHHFRNVADALGEIPVDLVVIATPTATHADVVVQVVTSSSAAILVEKPLVHERAALDRVLSAASEPELERRVRVAHHFAFSPEVLWAVELIAANPDWLPISSITSAFHDPYQARADQALASLGSSWVDSGINQLSMLARFVEFGVVTRRTEDEAGTSAWCVVSYRSATSTGYARLRTSWLAGSTSKRTTLVLADGGIEIWLDHTAMTGFAARGDELVAAHDNDGSTSRKLAHYRALYDAVATGATDPLLTFGTAATLSRLLHSGRVG